MTLKNLKNQFSNIYNKDRIFLSYESIAKASPLRQGMLVFLVAVLSILIWGTWSADQEIEWFIGVTAVGFYAWLNITISFFRKTKQWRYVGQSFLVLFGLTIGCLWVAKLVSSTHIFDLREYQLMLASVFIFYCLGLMVATFIKNVAAVMGIHY